MTSLCLCVFCYSDSLFLFLLAVQKWCRDDKAPSFLLPPAGDASGHATLDRTVHLKHVRESNLRGFLQAHGVAVTENAPVPALRTMVRTVRILNLKALSKAEHEMSKVRGDLKVSVPFTLVGKPETDWARNIARIRDEIKPQVSMAAVRRDFGIFNEVRRRAWRRFKGHLRLASLTTQFAIMPDRNNPTAKPRRVAVVTMDVMASLRTKIHRARAVFWMTGEEKGKFILAPASFCACEVGAVFCAHVLALLLFLFGVCSADRIWSSMAEGQGDVGALTPAILRASFPAELDTITTEACRLQFLHGDTARKAEVRMKKEKVKALKVLEAKMEEAEEAAGAAGETDEEMESEGDEKDTEVQVNFEKDVGAYLGMRLRRLMKDGLPEAPARKAESLYEAAAADVVADRDDYVSSFPRSLAEQYRADAFLERIYTAHKQGRIGDSNMTHFTLHSLKTRHARMAAFESTAETASLDKARLIPIEWRKRAPRKSPDQPRKRRKMTNAERNKRGWPEAEGFQAGRADKNMKLCTS